MAALASEQQSETNAAFDTRTENGCEISVAAELPPAKGVLVSHSGRILHEESRVPEKTQEHAGSCPVHHKWMVLISACICVGLSTGFAFSFGSLLLEVLDEFGESRALSATIQSVMVGVTTGAGAVNGAITSRIGHQKGGMIGGMLAFVGAAACYFATSTIFLIVCLGIVAGWGSSFVYVCTAAATRENFHGSGKYLALSFVSSSIGAGSVCFPYFNAWLTPQFGIQGTLLIISGLFLNIIPAAALWGPKAHTTVSKKVDNCEGNSEKRTKYTAVLRHTMRNKTFIVFLLTLVLTTPSFNTFISLAFEIFKFRGVDFSESLQIYQVFNIMITFGRLSPGLLKHIPHVGSMMILVVILTVGLVGFIGLILTRGYTAIMLSCIAIGGSFGGLSGCLTVIIAKIMDLEDFTAAVGITLTVVGIGNAITPPIGGLVYDRTKSYDVVLYYCAAGMVGAGTCSLFASILRWRNKPVKTMNIPKLIVTRL